MVGNEGFEPAIFWSQTRRDNQTTPIPEIAVVRLRMPAAYKRTVFILLNLVVELSELDAAPIFGERSYLGLFYTVAQDTVCQNGNGVD